VGKRNPEILEAGGGEQDLRYTCQGGLVRDEMSVIADRRIEATGGTYGIHDERLMEMQRLSKECFADREER
jgi:hypothetical protein